MTLVEAVALTAGAVASLGLAVWVVVREVRLWRRSRQRHGGVLELDTPAARAALDGEWEWPAPPGMRCTLIPIITDPTVEPGVVELRTTALRRCNPARGVHYHGHGETCECGERRNTAVLARLRLTGPDARQEMLRHFQGDDAA